MTHELFYTSAPRGLRGGSNGYCTVTATRGLPSLLGQQLERLSDYRPVLDGGDGAARQPVVLAHRRVSVLGKTYNVLSRICQAGVDHTQRSIFFAHHVALEPTELPSVGPAWLLAQSDFMQQRWDGQVRELPVGRRPPSGTVAPAVCRAWQQATGDAGWAGVLAESFLDDPNRPVYLLYPLGLDPLPLLAEALTLLPAEQRWRATFSTVHLAGPQEASCIWRCLPREAAEARKARNAPGALVLDLGSLLGPARGGPLVAAARTGKLIAAPSPAPPPAAASAPPGLLPKLTAPPPGSWMAPVEPKLTATPVEIAPELPPAPEPEPELSPTSDAPLPAAAPVGWFLPAAAGLLLGVLITGGGAAYGWHVMKQDHDKEMQAEKQQHQVAVQALESKLRKTREEKDSAIRTATQEREEIEASLRGENSTLKTRPTKEVVDGLQAQLADERKNAKQEAAAKDKAQKERDAREAVLKLVFDALFDPEKSYGGKALTKLLDGVRKGEKADAKKWKDELDEWMVHETDAVLRVDILRERFPFLRPQADLLQIKDSVQWIQQNRKDDKRKRQVIDEYKKTEARYRALEKEPNPGALVLRKLEEFKKDLDEIKKWVDKP